MNILLIHNKYQQPGGETAVVQKEQQLLQQYDHQVHLFEVRNTNIQSFYDKITVALRISYSKVARKAIVEQIQKYVPGIVHVHNFFPLLSPSIYDACREFGIPVVQTLHNYRIICPGALLMRQGRVCEICIKHSAYRALRYKCYRNSFWGTLSVARMVQTHRVRKTWHTKVHAFIALSEFARNIFTKEGLPSSKIFVKPNFVPNSLSDIAAPKTREGALFVGRISEEKGILTLLRAWQNNSIMPLRIAGTGPLYEQCREKHIETVEFLGWQTSQQVNDEMNNAAFIVMPSEWYEGFPMVLVEAFAHGLPVIASRLGALAEIISDGATGLLFEPGNANDLAAKVHWMLSHSDERQRMGQNARLEYLTKYTPERNYQMLMDIYERVLEKHHNA